jgi:hypothetical protein
VGIGWGETWEGGYLFTWVLLSSRLYPGIQGYDYPVLSPFPFILEASVRPPVSACSYLARNSYFVTHKVHWIGHQKWPPRNCKTVEKEIKEDASRWKDVPCSLEQQNIVNTICRFNAIPVKVPMSL